MPRDSTVVLGGGAASYERGTPPLYVGVIKPINYPNTLTKRPRSLGGGEGGASTNGMVLGLLHETGPSKP